MTTPAWAALRPGITAEHLGYLPGFLDDEDPRSASQQFAANYKFGGWRPMKGFTIGPSLALNYRGDPPIYPIAMTMLRDVELILLYPGDWVVIVQMDNSFEVCRMD